MLILVHIDAFSPDQTNLSITPSCHQVYIRFRWSCPDVESWPINFVVVTFCYSSSIEVPGTVGLLFTMRHSPGASQPLHTSTRGGSLTPLLGGATKSTFPLNDSFFPFYCKPESPFRPGWDKLKTNNQLNKLLVQVAKYICQPTSPLAKTQPLGHQASLFGGSAVQRSSYNLEPSCPANITLLSI